MNKKIMHATPPRTQRRCQNVAFVAAFGATVYRVVRRLGEAGDFNDYLLDE